MKMLFLATIASVERLAAKNTNNLASHHLNSVTEKINNDTNIQVRSKYNHMGKNSSISCEDYITFALNPNWFPFLEFFPRRILIPFSCKKPLHAPCVRLWYSLFGLGIASDRRPIIPKARME